jgi:hypothetical protein
VEAGHGAVALGRKIVVLTTVDAAPEKDCKAGTPIAQTGASGASSQ